MPSDLRLVFMGTPEFAVASLEAILLADYNVVAVITAPDKPAGRGMQLTESAVKKFAVSKGLLVLQPEKLKDPIFLGQLRAVRADLQIVVAFRMLPEVVWNMPPMGTVNLHGSLLPQYRGAAPINWAVINGESETGVTTFQLQQDIDTGSILLQDRFPIANTDTAGDVHDRMKVIGARLLVKTIGGLASGNLKGVPQVDVLRQQGIADGPVTNDPSKLKHAPKIFTETCHIDWSKPTSEIYNLIRGLSPFPAAFTELDGKTLKIFRSEKEMRPAGVPASKAPAADLPAAKPPGNEPLPAGPLLMSGTTHAPGTYDTDGKTWLRFATPDGYIRVTELQLEGKKKMAVGDFLRGYRF
jgi:methionyl-tRNA formyltransferase